MNKHYTVPQINFTETIASINNDSYNYDDLMDLYYQSVNRLKLKQSMSRLGIHESEYMVLNQSSIYSDSYNVKLLLDMINSPIKLYNRITSQRVTL